MPIFSIDAMVLGHVSVPTVMSEHASCGTPKVTFIIGDRTTWETWRRTNVIGRGNIKACGGTVAAVGWGAEVRWNREACCRDVAVGVVAAEARRWDAAGRRSFTCHATVHHATDKLEENAS